MYYEYTNQRELVSVHCAYFDAVGLVEPRNADETPFSNHIEIQKDPDFEGID